MKKVSTRGIDPLWLPNRRSKLDDKKDECASLSENTKETSHNHSKPNGISEVEGATQFPCINLQRTFMTLHATCAFWSPKCCVCSSDVKTLARWSAQLDWHQHLAEETWGQEGTWLSIARFVFQTVTSFVCKAPSMTHGTLFARNLSGRHTLTHSSQRRCVLWVCRCADFLDEQVFWGWRGLETADHHIMSQFGRDRSDSHKDKMRCSAAWCLFASRWCITACANCHCKWQHLQPKKVVTLPMEQRRTFQRITYSRWSQVPKQFQWNSSNWRSLSWKKHPRF